MEQSASGSAGQMPSLMEKLNRWTMIYNTYIDRTTIYRVERWAVTALLLTLFLLRVFLAHGWYLVTYGLGIYMLNLFLAFLTPKFLPESVQMQSMEEEEEESGKGGQLPTKQGEEFRPFIRRLPEFKFWYNVTKGIVISLTMTMSRVFDVPVFWPILLFYFIFLFGLTMSRQLKHMRKYGYTPFDFGKKTYSGQEQAQRNQ